MYAVPSSSAKSPISPLFGNPPAVPVEASCGRVPSTNGPAGAALANTRKPVGLSVSYVLIQRT